MRMTAPQKQQQIPYYLLLHIFSHLPAETLIVCKRVCTLWHSTILSSQRFRRLLFLQPPSPETAHARKPVVVHPVLMLLKSDWAIAGSPIVFSSACNANGKLLAECPVKDEYATEPALTTFLVVMPGYCVEIGRREGVRVWDVAKGVKKLFVSMAEQSKSTVFEDSCPATLNGFRQANRMRNNRKFIALFRYDESDESGSEGIGPNGLLVAG
ncbi:hypothetical protein BDD12DRAFT_891113 [Trichophaea hybrida]|nr:hypothetical protein BDD12DRAFT_891113 [Trichophaea hybrida]